MPFCCYHFMDIGHLINKLCRSLMTEQQVFLVFVTIHQSFCHNRFSALYCNVKGTGSRDWSLLPNYFWRPSLFLTSSLDEFLIPVGPFIPGPI
jgi:hypothetical protein